MASTRSEVPVAHASYDPGYGWVLYAAVLLMLLGTVNLIEGLAAVSNSQFFIRTAHYAVGSLNTWGWVVTVLGTFEFVTGFFVLTKARVARWAGVAFLALDMVVQLLLLPAAPFWSLAVFALNLAALYGLLVHGAVAPAPPADPAGA